MTRKAPKRPGKRQSCPQVIDIYSGAGGLSLGAARAGFKVAGAVELDSHAAATHKRNFPGTRHLEADVSKLTGTQLLEKLYLSSSELSGIVGGPPCQGFSCIGKNDADDPRNNLFVDFFRIISEAQPRFFLAENVPGIMNACYHDLREEALALVAKRYTLLPPMVICAKDFGAPTKRTRVFFFGYQPDEMEALSSEVFTAPKEIEEVKVGAALKGLPIRISPRWQTEEQGWRISRVYHRGWFAQRLQDKIPRGVGDPYALERLRNESRASGCLGTQHSTEIAQRYGAIEPGKRDRISKSHRLDLDDFCPTIRAGTGRDRGRFQAVRPIHPTEARVITPREAARLQGFPDWFRFSAEKWHSFREIGSSVSPILAERLLAVIRKALTLD